MQQSSFPSLHCILFSLSCSQPYKCPFVLQFSRFGPDHVELSLHRRENRYPVDAAQRSLLLHCSVSRWFNIFSGLINCFRYVIFVPRNQDYLTLNVNGNSQVCRLEGSSVCVDTALLCPTYEISAKWGMNRQISLLSMDTRSVLPKFVSLNICKICL